MRFFQVVISGAALIAAALALELNDVPTSIEPGKTYTITYSPKDNTPTTLVLRKGVSTNLDTIATITTSATGGSFQWTVDASLPNADNYALEIKQANVDPNYSGLIKLTGSSAQASSSGSATPSAYSASSASAQSSAASSKASATAVTTTLATATSVSAGVSSTPGSNSTIVSATLSRTATGSSSPGSTASTTGSSPPNSTGAASMLGSSPVALIFGAVAALAYL